MVSALLTGCVADPDQASGSASATSDQVPQQTAEVLLEGMFTDLQAAAEQLGGGQWTYDEKHFDVAMDRTELHPAPCRSGDLAGPDAMDGPLQFELVLQGPGHEEPEPALDRVAQWAQDQGFTQTERGQGATPQHGDRFVALQRPDGTLLTVNVSTERSKVAEYTACSDHPSLKEYKGSGYTSPGNRFTTQTPAPEPSSTKLGGSG